MAENLKTKTVKGVWWSLLEKYSTQGVSFIVTLVMARILTPELYGLIGMTALYMALGQVFIDGGFANALIQKEDRYGLFDGILDKHHHQSGLLWIAVRICSTHSKHKQRGDSYTHYKDLRP